VIVVSLLSCSVRHAWKEFEIEPKVEFEFHTTIIRINDIHFVVVRVKVMRIRVLVVGTSTSTMFIATIRAPYFFFSYDEHLHRVTTELSSFNKVDTNCFVMFIWSDAIDTALIFIKCDSVVEVSLSATDHSTHM